SYGKHDCYHAATFNYNHRVGPATGYGLFSNSRSIRGL
ncbi:uncharacterized protein METZ01_LOCUS459948, partial [marine metagenome]